MAQPPSETISLQPLVTIMSQQLDMQKQMMEQQLELQQQHMKQQLEQQRQRMESQLKFMEEYIRKAGPNKPIEIAALDSYQLPDGNADSTGTKGSSTAKTANTAPEWRGPVADQGNNAAVVTPISSVDLAKKIDSAKSKLDAWIKCSGLWTVDKWVSNYRKHPAGWGALLMIHGVPEVTNRLRQKVQNYAVFAALFLAGSIKTMTGKIPFCTEEPSTLECDIRKRVFIYSFTLTIISMILCIMLAMAFHNALNEAARDCDVFRMFSRGKGFIATMRCQNAFLIGVIACIIGITSVVSEPLGVEAVVWVFVMTATAFAIYWHTSSLLFRNASIVSYWREELGGRPDKDDPYDLSVAVNLFLARTEQGNMSFSGAQAQRESCKPQAPEGESVCKVALPGAESILQDI